MPEGLQRVSSLVIGGLHRMSADSVTRGWAVMFAGTTARLSLGLVASVLIARGLGPADFGVYSVLAAAVGIASAIADLGLTSAAVKRIAAVLQNDVAEAWLRARSYFWLKVGAAGLVTVAGILLATPLARHLLNLAGHELLLRLALLGVAATALSGAVSGILQATEKFGRLSIVLIVNSALTAVLAGALVWTDRLTLVTALVVLGIGTSVISFAVGRRFLPADWHLRPPHLAVVQVEGRHLFRFGRWLWIAGIFAMLTARLDVLLVNGWSASATVGVYALALNLATKVDAVNQSLYTVLLPAASALKDDAAIRDYIRRGLIRSALISLGVLLLIPLAHPLITLLYGPAFAPAAPLFQLLIGVVIFDIFATPALLLAFPLDQPQLVAAGDAARAGTLALLGVALIPTFGPTGAVIAKFGAKVAGAALVLILLVRRHSQTWNV